MGFSDPKDVFGFTVSIVAAVFCVALIGSAGSTIAVGTCNATGPLDTPFDRILYCVGGAFGLIVSVAGFLLAVASILFHIMDELWDMKIARIVLTIGPLALVLFSLICIGLYVGAWLQEGYLVEAGLSIGFCGASAASLGLMALFNSMSHGGGVCGCFN